MNTAQRFTNGQTVRVGKRVGVIVEQSPDGWVRIEWPTGRVTAYPAARVEAVR